MLRLPGKALREIQGKLAAMEQRVLSETTALQEARQWSRPLMETLDRIISGKMATQLAALRDEGVTIVELPVTHEGKVFTIPIRIIRRNRKGKELKPGGFHIQIVTELSKLGEVQTKIDTSGKGLAVRFNVRDMEARDKLRREQLKLEDALKAFGWEPSVATVIAKEQPLSLFDLFEGDSDYLGVDMRA
jgi:hypothetical protein